MAARKRLFWQLYPSYLIITLVSLFAVTWYAVASFRHFYFSEMAARLEQRVRLVQHDLLFGGTPLQSSREWGGSLLHGEEETLTRLGMTLVLPSGDVIGRDEAETGGNVFAQLPEVVQALAGRVGIARRYNYPQQADTMFVAVPLELGGKPVAALRASLSLGDAEQAFDQIRVRIVLGGLAIAVLVVFVSYFVARRITLPLEQIRGGAECFAQGDLTTRLPRYRFEEINGLAETMNQMAAQLDDRIRAVMHQRNELEAVLSSMVEAVLAVDNEERVISMNNAAGVLFETDPLAVQGQSIQEAVRNPNLQAFITRTLSSRQPMEDDIIVRRDTERILQGHGTVLRDSDGSRMGAVIVLNDVTQLRHLETIRKDFVANVSHEIRTPITAIKGFVETLREGAMGDPDDAERFLTIIQKHIDRLNILIEDLLNLSRIEQDKENAQIELSTSSIRDVLANALQVCQAHAETKGMKVELSCPEDLNAEINRQLLEQAVVNLLDNAIKYSEDGTPIFLSASPSEDGVVIRVQDLGRGIEKQHLPRLFERFYRVDKARSRRFGGTGLGLAIVKHIVQAHGGKVSVQSTVGKGSTFEIRLLRVVGRPEAGKADEGIPGSKKDSSSLI